MLVLTDLLLLLLRLLAQSCPATWRSTAGEGVSANTACYDNVTEVVPYHAYKPAGRNSCISTGKYSMQMQVFTVSEEL